MRQRKEELAEILALEAGKPIVAGLAEIDRTIATYQFAAEGAKQAKGETVPMDAPWSRGSNRLDKKRTFRCNICHYAI